MLRFAYTVQATHGRFHGGEPRRNAFDIGPVGCETTTPPSNKSRLQVSTATVFLTDRLTGGDLLRCWRLLPASEIACGAGFRVSADRERFLTGRILLRLALTHVNGGDPAPADWRFRVDSRGKPHAVPGQPHLNFNLSHAGTMVAVAIDTKWPIGVDVERIEDGQAEELPWCALSHDERRFLDECNPDVRYHEFVKLWTLKEAIAKRSGDGVHRDFSLIETPWWLHPTEHSYAGEGANLETRTVQAGTSLYQVSVATHPDAQARPSAWHTVCIVGSGPDTRMVLKKSVRSTDGDV